MLCELGFGHSCVNQFASALRYYEEAMQQFPTTIGKSFYHSGDYFGAAVCSKNYSKAQTIFDQYLLPRIQATNNRSVLFDLYFMAAWFCLHQKKYAQTAEYLRLLQQYKKKETTIMGQAMLRQLESAYFYFSNDLSTAALTIEKNLRFLQKLMRQSNYAQYYLQYVDVLSRLIKLEQGTLRSPDKLFALLDSMPQGVNQFYNIPLQERAARWR